MDIRRNPLRDLLRGREERIPATLETSEEVRVGVGQPTKQLASAASQDTVEKYLAILNLDSDGKITADLRIDLIRGLKAFLANDKKLQAALVQNLSKNDKRTMQIVIDILDSGIPFSVNQISASGNSNQSLREHLSSCPDTTVEPPDLWSTISDQSLKGILEHANTVINAELKKQGGITGDLNLFKKEIDSLEDKIDSANKAQVANLKKLFTLGNACKSGAITILSFITSAELTGGIDYTPFGQSKVTTPPPAQVENSRIRDMITNFPGQDLRLTQPRDIGEQINAHLNLLNDSSPFEVATYYQNTFNPLFINGKATGMRIQVNMKTKQNESLKTPFMITFQKNDTLTQIVFIPIKDHYSLKQVGDKVIVITVNTGNAPMVRTEQGNLQSLL